MHAQNSAGVVAAAPVGVSTRSGAGRADVGGRGRCDGGRGAHVCAGAGHGALAVRVAGVAVHDLAGGVESLDLDVLVQVRDAVDVAVGGEGAVGGLEGGGGAGDEGAQGQVVEDLAAVAPDIGAAVLAQTLVVEAVDGGDLARLVVAADQCYAVGVTDFEAEEEEEGLERVEAAVDEVALSISTL